MHHGPFDIGSSHPRLDALPKACGREQFSSDIQADGMLLAGAKRAGLAHARLLRVDTEQARQVPGVEAVLTRADVPGTNRQGIIHKDMPVLCGSTIRHAGDAVALVVARDRKSLREALSLIRIETAPLPVVGDLDQALADGAPLVHEEHGTNVLLQATIAKGDADTALAECDIVLEDTFHTPAQAHAFLETENGTAQLDNDGVLHMTVSTQAPFRDRFEIAHALSLSPQNIHVQAPLLGGGFGGKDGATVQCLLALAALKLPGRHIRMTWDREENFLAGYKRHAARMHYTLGAMHDGTVKALRCELYYDTGAYAHLGGEIMELGLEHAAGPYNIPHVHARGFAVYTNNPIGGAFRGFGVAQSSFAFEGMMDRLARRLGRDPLDLRRQNALHRGHRNGAGVTLTTSTGLDECLRQAAEHPHWRERDTWQAQAEPNRLRGVGAVALWNGMGYGRGLPDNAIAKIELTANGRFLISSGVPDMGQGNSSTFAQIAGELLCQPAENLEVLQPDTERCHPSGSASAGRTTYTYGMALIRACELLRTRLHRRAALFLMVDEADGFALLPGVIRHLPSGREVPLPLMAGMLSRDDRVAVGEYLMPVTKDVPDTGHDFPIGFPHHIFPYAAHLVRLEIDTLTGTVTVCDYTAFTDGGQILNPQNYHQQIEGGVAQGLGFALMEGLQTQGGLLRTKNLSTYILPTALDLPACRSHAVPTVEHSGPFGMKGIGEIAMNGPLPAAAAALVHATGVHVNHAPLTAERILNILDTVREHA